MSDWRASFYAAVGEWLDRTLPERRPHGNWAKVFEVIKIAEQLDPGCDGDTPVSAAVTLTIEWMDVTGEVHSIAEELMLTDLMAELT